MSSTPLMKTPKSQLTAEQPLTKYHWNLPNRYPTYRDEEATRDGRWGTITIKSNPIPSGWATRKLENNYITEVLP